MNYLKYLAAVSVCSCVSLFASAKDASAITFTFNDFNNYPSSANQTLTSPDTANEGGLQVDLETTNVESFDNPNILGLTSTRNELGENGIYEFTFDQNIASFTADISFVNFEEQVNNFSTAPTSVTGGLTLTGSSVGTSDPSPQDPLDVNASGSINFTGLNTNTLSFTFDVSNFGNDTQGGIAFDSFDVTPVPFEAEGTMGLLALGGYLGYRYLKQRKSASLQNEE